MATVVRYQNVLRRLLLALVAVVASLLLAAAPVAAIGDCQEAPLPESPNAGIAGQIDPVIPPEVVPTDVDVEDLAGPDPFDPASGTTIYEEYGWGGWDFHNYDPPDAGVPLNCGDNRGAAGFSNSVANAFMWASTLLASLVVLFARVVFAPETIAMFTPVMEMLLEATGFSFFFPMLWLGGGLTCLYLLVQARKGDVAKTAQDTGWSFMVMVITVGLIFHGSVIAPAADNLITGTVAYVGESAATGSSGIDGDLPTMIGANLSASVLYESWASGTFGRDNEATAEEYGPDLFRASHYSRTERAAMDADPSIAGELREAKQDRYNEIAEEIQDANEDAYLYMSGAKNGDRIGYGVLALMGMLIAAPFLMVAMLKMIGALLIMRISIGVFPGIALIGQHPKYSRTVFRVWDLVWSSLIAALIFGVAAVVWIAAGIGTLLSPTTGVPLVFAYLILAVGSWALWKIIGKVHVVPESVRSYASGHTPSPRGGHHSSYGRGRRRSPAPPPPAGSGSSESSTAAPAAPSSPAPPPPGPRSRPMARAAATGAAKGAAQTAAIGFVTGGTVTAAGAALGAARGAATAGYAERQRQKMQQQNLPYYEATPHRAPPPPQATTAGVGTGSRIDREMKPLPAGTTPPAPPAPRRANTMPNRPVVEPTNVYDPNAKAGPTGAPPVNATPVRKLYTAKGSAQ